MAIAAVIISGQLATLIFIMLAQATSNPTDWLAPVGGTAVAGAMLHWFMIRNERRMIAVENASNRTTRAVLLLVVSLDTSSAAAREAKVISREIDDSEKSTT